MLCSTVVPYSDKKCHIHQDPVPGSQNSAHDHGVVGVCQLHDHVHIHDHDFVHGASRATALDDVVERVSCTVVMR